MNNGLNRVNQEVEHGRTCGEHEIGIVRLLADFQTPCFITLQPQLVPKDTVRRCCRLPRRIDDKRIGIAPNNGLVALLQC